MARESQSRLIGGKQYSLAGFHQTNRAAFMRAQALRQKGKSVRVIKTHTTTGKPKWNVWVRPQVGR